jgi:hypothetical protein
VARLVDLLSTEGGAIAAEVLPAQAIVGEDADQAAAFAAHRDGLVVAVVGGNGDRGERDLERLRVEHAQQGEGGLHLVQSGVHMLGELVDGCLHGVLYWLRQL